MELSSNLGDNSSRDVEEVIGAPTQGANLQPQSPGSQPDQRTEPVGPAQGVNPTRTTEVETVIVLSFRSLQLQRIAQLQDDLLLLAARDAAGNAPPDHSENVDKALDNYGNAVTLAQCIDLSVHSKSTSQLRDAISPCIARSARGCNPYRKHSFDNDDIRTLSKSN